MSRRSDPEGGKRSVAGGAPTIAPESAGAAGAGAPRRVARVVAWAVVLVVFVALRVPFVSVPFERDEGEYAYIAQRALHGDLPYRDAFDQKPPGIFLIYAAAFVVAGQSVESVHVAAYAAALLTLVLLYRLVSRRFGDAAGLSAALAFAVAGIDPSLLGQAANTEVFMIAPLTGALLCLVPTRGSPSRRRVLAAGALAAAGFWIKPVAATNIVFLALWLVSLRRSENPRSRSAAVLGDLGWLALGGAAVTAPVVAYFLARGALAPFIYCVFTFNSTYATQLAPPLPVIPAVFWNNVRAMIPPLWPILALSAAGAASLRRAPRREWFLFLGWPAFSLAGACIGGYFREHYFIQALPAFAALAGIGAANLAERLGRHRGALAGRAALAAAAAAMVAAPVVVNRAMLLARNPEAVDRMIYGSNPFDYSQAIAAEVERLTAPTDTVLVIGSEPQILFYAHRRSATRYIYLSPLAAQPYDGLERQLDATLREVERARPKVVVDVTRIPTSLLAGPRTNRGFFRALAGIVSAQGLEPVSFFKPLPLAAHGGGPLFTVLEPQAVLREEARRRSELLGVMVLYRR